MQIWKFNIGLGEQNIRMPLGAKILTAQFQGEFLCVWAMCNPGQKEYETRCFRIVGTGANIDATIPLKYISTVQNGMFVWHVFEVIT
jgi:hypothetical protein